MLFNVIETASPWQGWLDNLKIRQAALKDLPDLLSKINTSGLMALDIETDGLDPYLNEIHLIQIAPGPVPKPGDSTEVFFLKPEKAILFFLASIIEDRTVTKIIHNACFDLKFIQAKAGRRLNPRNLFDTMLASQLVTAGDFIPEHQLESWLTRMGITKVKHGATHYYDQHGHEIKLEKDTAKQTRPVYLSHSLQQVAHRYLEVWLPKDEQTSNWSGELTQDQLVYAAKDAAVLLPLYEILNELLERNSLQKTALLEFACIPAVIEIETAGMPFDSQKAGEILAEIESSIKGLISAIEVPNINSSVQVQQKLIELGQEYLQGDSFVIEGETFEVSSSDEVLSRMKARLPENHPLAIFITNIQEYRHLKKKADMLKKWLETVHPVTGRLHTSLKQINNQGVGRFSAREPNLQQISRESEIRALFKAEPGRKLVIADYSGIEMRIMAQLSRDRTLIQAFKDGIDIHRFTASKISGKSLDEVTRDERQAAKAVGFGMIYGMSSQTLKLYAETSYGVVMTEEEAKKAREGFFKTYPGIEKWHQKQTALVSEKNFKDYWVYHPEKGFICEKRPQVRTLGGRLRVWPVTHQTRMSRAGQTENSLKKVGPVTELFNTPDQGTGADMIKLAMAYIYRELISRQWADVYLIGCVHDELILDTPEDKAEEVEKLLTACMLKAASKLLPDVPVEVEAHVAESWAEK